MTQDFDNIIEYIIEEWEGGEVNDPNDPGGHTKYGISKNAFPSVNISELTKKDAKSLYKKNYWDTAYCNEIPKELRAIHLDTAINMGVHAAISILQEAGGTSKDGIFGPKTKAAARDVTVDNYAFRRAIRYLNIIGDNETLAKYSTGWSRRLVDIYKISCGI